MPPAKSRSACLCFAGLACAVCAPVTYGFGLVFGHRWGRSARHRHNHDRRLAQFGIISATESTDDSELCIDIAAFRFSVGIILSKIIPGADEPLISLIVSFVGPAVPRVAVARGNKLWMKGKPSDLPISLRRTIITTLSADGNVVAATLSHSPTIVVWRLHSSPVGSAAPVSLLGLSTDAVCVGVDTVHDRVVAGSADGTICVWAISTSALATICTAWALSDGMIWGHSFPVRAVATGALFNDFGFDLVSGDSGGIFCMWESCGESGGAVGTCRVCVSTALLVGRICRVWSVAVSPRLALCGLEGLVLGYHAPAGTCALVLHCASRSPVRALAASGGAAARRAVACCADGAVLHWDAGCGGQGAQAQARRPRVLGAQAESSTAGVKGDPVLAPAPLACTAARAGLVCWARGRAGEEELRWSSLTAGRPRAFSTRSVPFGPRSRDETLPPVSAFVAW